MTIQQSGIFLVMFLWTGCAFHWVERTQTYQAGDNIEGEKLRLHQGGDFEYTRWQDHYRESIGGSYALFGNVVRLHASIFDDSLRVQERVVPQDSTRFRVEIWDGRWMQKLSDLTNIRIALLWGDSLVTELTADNGQIAFSPELAFDRWRLIAGGILLQKTYKRQHPKANYFYLQYRFGNLHQPHLHFDNTPWRYTTQAVRSQLKIEGKRRIQLLQRQE